MFVLHEAGAEQSADGNSDENEDQRQRPALGQEAAKQGVSKKRKQENQGEIAKITLTEKNMFERAEIPQAGAAVVKNLFAAFQRAKKIAGQQFLQNHASDAIVKETVVAAIEWPKAAEETGVVHRDDQRGQADNDKRVPTSGWS